VERNAKRAALVAKAEDWPWSSAHVRLQGSEQQKRMLSPWPVEEPRDYRKWLTNPKARKKSRISGMRSKGAGPMDRRSGYRKRSRNSGCKTPCGSAGDQEKVHDIFLFLFPDEFFKAWRNLSFR
jgi:hypothetical protein